MYRRQIKRRWQVAPVNLYIIYQVCFTLWTIGYHPNIVHLHYGLFTCDGKRFYSFIFFINAGQTTKPISFFLFNDEGVQLFVNLLIWEPVKRVSQWFLKYRVTDSCHVILFFLKKGYYMPYLFRNKRRKCIKAEWDSNTSWILLKAYSTSLEVFMIWQKLQILIYDIEKVAPLKD